MAVLLSFVQAAEAGMLLREFEAREHEENAFQYKAYFFLVIRNKVTTSSLLVKTITELAS